MVAVIRRPVFAQIIVQILPQTQKRDSALVFDFVGHSLFLPDFMQMVKQE